MIDLTIRPLQAADRPEWHRLWTGYLTFYDNQLPQSVYESTFSRLLPGGDPDMACRLAVMGGRPVGLVHFLFHNHCWRPEGACYLQDIYAEPDSRGQGAGRAMIEAVYAAAEERGVPFVYWHTHEFNTIARRLYDRIGRATPFIKYVRD
ncbi:GNAT family N-acetyltransferase [Rhodovulum adriaticum]|uniref:Acetyltransferase (GNAT) family protein n=1 Tax=Rhodovulum adriaticum TaxID=35804 RepID=A0A4R2NTY6_RHOAD|nr:GNAT family N-acetyltransferase [Rhodovulum adriaticum]MBK1635971.1 GNAT family N-acetyltransferase [Rhodovulum adriaticum]TCP25430.1 acetyltransferase (GNAT) family protein [Rhodovulum adriaticum]